LVINEKEGHLLTIEGTTSTLGANMSESENSTSAQASSGSSTGRSLVLQNFRKVIDTQLDVIVQQFLERGEHNSAHTSLDEQCEKLLKDASLHGCLQEAPLILNSEILFEAVTETQDRMPANSWATRASMAIFEELEIGTVKELIDALKDEKGRERIETIIKRENTLPVSVTEYRILKTLESFKFFNKESIQVVEDVTRFAFVMRATERFYRTLEMSSFASINIYRAIAVPDPENYLKKLLGGEVTLELGVNWSRKAKRAVPYLGKKDQSIIRFWGIVDPSGIDYLESVIKNISVTHGQFEEELVVVPGADVLVHQIDVLTSELEPLESIVLDSPIRTTA
jgi:hypothetical protein